MYKPWNKLSKDEKMAYAQHKFMKGFAISAFGLVWHYLMLTSGDVWGSFPLTLAIMGVLMLILGIVKRLMV